MQPFKLLTWPWIKRRSVAVTGQSAVDLAQEYATNLFNKQTQLRMSPEYTHILYMPIWLQATKIPLTNPQFQWAAFRVSNKQRRADL